MEAIIIHTNRTDYGIDDVINRRKAMTAGELAEFFSRFDEDTPVVLSFDNGYTYGPIREDYIEETEVEEER